jgi:hypothetical protein
VYKKKIILKSKKFRPYQNICPLSSSPPQKNSISAPSLQNRVLFAGQFFVVVDVEIKIKNEYKKFN